MSNHLFRKFLLGLTGTGLVACSATPSEPDVTLAPDGARIIKTEGGALTSATIKAPLAVVRDFLRTRGAGLAVDGLSVVRTSTHDGITQLRLQQEVEGVRVHNAYVKAAINDSGELLHLIERVAPVAGSIAAPAVSEKAALAAVLAHLGYEVQTPVERARRGTTTKYERLSVFHAEPTVERVLFADDHNQLVSGFVVTTWGQSNNQLDETLVDGKGRIVAVERRTNSERYNVFVEDPSKGGQTIVTGGVNNASPNGWLAAGNHRSIAISGNNTSTYLDADANNGADAGGTTISDGDFLAVANLEVSPSTDANRAVAVQNLFYLNNVMHDVLHRHGFNEANGNFQKDNFGRGGLGNDPVLAEAQDGSGTDNANFATPNDGSSPRMQMYLWSGVDGDGLVTVGGVDYDAYGSSFGGALTLGGVSGALALYNDGTGVTSDGCEASVGLLTGKIAIVDRGTCNFTVKVLNAQKAGAVGVIIANNDASGAFAAGGTDRKVKIPSGMVSLADGNTLRAKLDQSASLRKNPVPPLFIDGDVDADIVFHEYGHGLTWRMIGSMSGALAGAIGEGASDVVAFLMNGDDRVGEYSYSSPLGIRRAPYADYTLTYSKVTGAEVHDDGEIYAAAMWRVFELYQAAGLSADALMGDFVDGMNYTPATPAFENMRDGMLQSVAARNLGSRTCLIWKGFAEFGIGVGAKGTVSRRGVVTITESFTKPAQCI